MPGKLPKDVQALIDIYAQAKMDLIKTISEKEARGNVTWYQKTLLKQVNQQLQELNRKAKDWVDVVIPENYQQGIDDVNAQLKKLGISISGSEAFAGLHKDAVGIMAKNTYADLAAANLFVGRAVQDAVRQSGIEAVSQKLAQGQTVKQCKQLLVNKLIDQGLNGIRDKRGRMIGIDSYASTVARSTTREATNRATLNQLTGLGHDLVKISSHATSCQICAPLQGRVYSISGSDKRYPALSIAHSGDHANIHPNCRHVLMPYIEALASDPEKDRIYSNRPFNIDSRSQADLESYNKDQAKKRKLRDDKAEFENYRLALPYTSPKSFSGFQSMKRSDSKRWKQLQEDYRNLVQKTSKNDIIEVEPRISKLFKGQNINPKALAATQEAFKEVVEFGKKNGIENLYHLDIATATKAIETLKGTGSQVVFTQELIDFLDNAPKESVLSIHNHPKSSSFSSADMNVMSKFDSIKALAVTAHDGTYYLLSVGDGERPSGQRIMDAYKFSRDKYHDEFANKYLRGELTESQAWKEHSNAINEDVANKFGWTYGRVLPNE